MIEDFMQNFSIQRFFLGVLISAYLAHNGIKKKSLSFSGCVAAIIVGLISFTVSIRFGVILILFYKSSSILTKYKGEEKNKLDDHSLEGGQRSYIQVFSCSLIASVVALIFFFVVGEDCPIDFNSNPTASSLLCAYIGHYACANGDTWASELGVLSQSHPRLITTLCMRKVPPGTNGGVSWLGTGASVMGGAFIGLGFYIMSFFVSNSGDGPSQLYAVTLGSFAGFFGSMVDSFLGATLQSSSYNKDKKCITLERSTKAGGSDHLEHICGLNVLSNEQVNVLSVLMTTVLCGVVGQHFFFG